MTTNTRTITRTILTATVLGAAALGLAGTAAAAPTATTPQSTGNFHSPNTYATPAPTVGPGWYGNHGPAYIAHLTGK